MGKGAGLPAALPARSAVVREAAGAILRRPGAILSGGSVASPGPPAASVCPSRASVCPSRTSVPPPPGRLPGSCLGMGRLWRCLARGEYGQLRDCPLFESDFLQVTRSGEAASRVTVGIAASSPLLPLPDLMLLARPVPPSPPEAEELQLFGLLPLSCVRLSLHSRRRHQLRARLATGRTFYLQLLAPPRHLRRLFTCWIRLLFLLREPGGCPPGPPAPRGLPGAVGDPQDPPGDRVEP
ncbi:Golgi-associated RAB2 interactor protein 5A-like [Phalacrocorax carbo]|uniref:Golgi-associated RAB2 interactor protein 5A-like n=1 Tax=Phalacrocorax carbo TaxID=9209 RepID=UPI0031195B89